MIRLAGIERIVTRDFLPTISIILKRWLVPASVFCHFSSFAGSGYPLSLPPSFEFASFARIFPPRPPRAFAKRSISGTKLIIRTKEKKKRKREEDQSRASIDDPSWRRRDIFPRLPHFRPVTTWLGLSRQALSRFYRQKLA